MASQRSENYYLVRAGCAPLVMLSFLAVGIYWVERWFRDFLPEGPAFGFALFGLSIAAGVPYFWRIGGPVSISRRVSLLLFVYIPVMAFVLWWYGLYFSMLVLGVFP